MFYFRSIKISIWNGSVVEIVTIKNDLHLKLFYKYLKKIKNSTSKYKMYIIAINDISKVY